MHNVVALIGRLGADPETRYTPQGTCVVNLNLAVNDKYGDRDDTYWFRVVVWGKTAEIAAQYLKKGNKVGITGKLVQRSWEDNQGQKRSTIEVNCRELELLGGNGSHGTSQSQGPPQGQSKGSKPSTPPPPPPDSGPYPGDDDIPF